MYFFKNIYFLLFLICKKLIICIGEKSSDFNNDYCIIGAGPAGIQMAYYLHNSNRNYTVFEKNNHAGLINIFILPQI